MFEHLMFEVQKTLIHLGLCFRSFILHCWRYSHFYGSVRNWFPAHDSRNGNLLLLSWIEAAIAICFLIWTSFLWIYCNPIDRRNQFRNMKSGPFGPKKKQIHFFHTFRLKTFNYYNNGKWTDSLYIWILNAYKYIQFTDRMIHFPHLHWYYCLFISSVKYTNQSYSIERYCSWRLRPDSLLKTFQVVLLIGHSIFYASWIVNEIVDEAEMNVKHIFRFHVEEFRVWFPFLLILLWLYVSHYCIVLKFSKFKFFDPLIDCCPNSIIPFKKCLIRINKCKK